MQVKRFVLIAAALLPAAFAQTSSDCNPLKGCFKDDPALGTTYSWDYTKNHGEAPRFDIVSSASRISYQDDGMHMSVTMRGDSPTLQSQFYIFWGRAEIVMKAGPGAGIVSSLVFQSDVLDEIDVEFIGNQPGNVQTNIFSKGNQDVHIYGANTAVADTVGVFHKYTVDWTPQQITWSIDGNVVRVLSRAELGETVYPQTPMQIKFGPWAAGDPSNAPGTIEWAGGPIDYSLAPFDMVVASLSITDYSTGATKYRYKDTSGSAASIEITGGGIVNPPPQQETTSSAPPPAPTTTSAPQPPPTTTSSKPPLPPPTTTSTPPPPPPPPTTTSITTSSKPPPPKPTTTSSEEEETTTSVEETSTSYRPTKSTFSIETTHASTSIEPTERSGETTLATVISTQSSGVRLPTNSDVPSSGSSIRTASPLVIAIVALFVLF
ncbi:hypothetical protein TWF217_010306 [Orbilia oligospora]|nr:hypothetical protein TWF128_006058 [Orbilia oligospora]KAF3269034.1 hypothetical protein TWF217_010306 [Orbilia oligospora]KAF3290523.1 hypothetical protein TWF132_006848 [Orbilia oligospora]